ncbi:MAG: Flp pilus assembly protein CpaB [Syntrophobacterales bacterium]
MGKYKAVVPIILALVIAAAGSLFLYQWLQHQGGPKEVVVKKQAEAVPVAVAAADLPWGTKLKKEMIKTLPFLKESLPSGYVSKPEKLEGRIIIAQLKKNEPITESRLAPDSITSGGVSAVLQPGKRAVAVKGDKVIGISGFIKPGNRVDVLVTMTDPRNKQEVTKIVLENVQVLATGTQIQENNEGKPSPVDVYTLEVTPDEAEKLGLAATHGKLQFALRNITDDKTVLTRGATVSHALASFRGPGPKPKTSSNKKIWRPRKNVTTVEVIKGNKVSKKKFKL